MLLIPVALELALGYAKGMSNLQNKNKFSTAPVEERANAIVAWLDLRKAQEITKIELFGKQAFADVIIVCSAQSVRQRQALADGVAEFCREANYEFLGMEGYNPGQWILVDLNDIIINIFQEQSRQLYRLEDLWQSVRDQVEAGRAPSEEKQI